MRQDDKNISKTSGRTKSGIIAVLLVFGLLTVAGSPIFTGVKASQGDPVAGATIQVSFGTGSNSTQTDSAGFYSVGVTDNVTLMSVYAQGYLNREVVNHSTGPIQYLPGGTIWKNITLVPQPPSNCTIKGYVKDRKTGVPLSNVYISVDVTDDQGNYFMVGGENSVSTDADGYYSISVPAGDVYMWFNADGYYGIYECAFTILNGTKWVNQTLVPQPPDTVTVSGTVSDISTGMPLTDAYLSFSGTTGPEGVYYVYNYTYTDQNGQYTLRLPEGNYTITISASGYHKFSENHTFTEGQNAVLDFSLDPYPVYDLHLQFVDQSGALVSDVNVSWSLSGSVYDSGSGTSDSSGWYNISTYGGNMTVSVSKQGYWDQTISYIVPGTQSTHTITMTKVDLSASVHGNVTFNGTLVYGAFIMYTVTSPNGTYTASITTDFDGTYYSSLPSGTVEMYVSYSYSSLYVSETYTFTLSAGENKTLNVDLVPRALCTIQGYVTEGVYAGHPVGVAEDLDGDMLPDDWERQYGLDPSWPFDAYMDTDGDGYKNFEEYYGNSDPTDPSSVPGGVVGGDTIPPAVITDLAVVGFTDTTVTLSWTSVGDDGMSGNLSSYIIVWSTTGPFSNLTDPSLSEAPQTTAPLPPGFQEVWTFYGLTPNTTYWVAIVAVDDGGNRVMSNVVSFTTAQPPEEISQLINADTGGNITMENGVEIYIPPGALQVDVEITIRKLNVNGTQTIGEKYYLVSDYYEFGPDGIAFSQPVTIKIPYDPNSLPEGVTEQNLAIYYLNGTVWEPIPGCTVDTANHFVTAQITHFSRYAVLATEEDTGGGGGGGAEDLNGFLYLLGSIGPIPTMLLLIVVILIVLGVLVGRKKKKPTHTTAPPQPATQPPAQQYPAQQQSQYPPQAYQPPPGRQQPMYQPAQQYQPQAPQQPPAQYPAYQQPQPVPPAPPQPVPGVPAPETSPAPTEETASVRENPPEKSEKKKPTKGKCKECGSTNLEFYDDGSGKCLDCGRTFWWDKSRAPQEF